jgi:hypothetical protein
MHGVGFIGPVWHILVGLDLKVLFTELKYAIFDSQDLQRQLQHTVLLLDF